MDRGASIIRATIAPDAIGWRLDRALAAALPTLSRERLKALISSGEVLGPEGAAVRDPSSKAIPGGAYQVHVPAPAQAHNEAQDIPLAIVYEDEHLIVVDKPAGMVVHPAAGNLDGTMVNALLHHCAGRLSGIGGVARPGIVHRIDKGTSGLLVVAKTDRTHEGLAAQFARHSIDRRYKAIVAGIPNPPSGTVDAPLALLVGQSAEDGDCFGRPGQACGHPLRSGAAAQGSRPRRMQTGNRPHAPGARPHDLAWPSFARRSGLWAHQNRSP